MSERKPPADRQAKIDSGQRVAVGLAVIHQGDGYATCSCGHTFVHTRRKVRETAIQRHLDKKHGGEGLWL